MTFNQDDQRDEHTITYLLARSARIKYASAALIRRMARLGEAVLVLRQRIAEEEHRSEQRRRREIELRRRRAKRGERDELGRSLDVHRGLPDARWGKSSDDKSIAHR